MKLDDTAVAQTLVETSSPAVARGSSVLIPLEMRSSVLPRGSGMIRTTAAHPARFEPMRVIGRGGLGEVTLVRDHDIDRQVAIKRLHGTPSDEQVMRFAHEVRTVGQLEHPNVAPVYDVGVDDTGQHYFVMRYVEGETLEMVIAQLASGDPEYHARYPFERRVEVFGAVLHALEYAHAKGILHRDIKPANIMIGPYGEVMLMDWGIAKHTQDKPSPRTAESGDARPDLTGTRDGALVGTPLYMSPEQASGRTDEIDERSDVYALSVLFYELLALQHYLPEVSSVPELLEAISTADHVHACYVRTEVQAPVPAELSWFVEKGLEKDPANRYQSVTEMLAALQRINTGKFAVQCPVTLMKRAGNDAIRFADKEPKVAMFVAVAVAVLALFGAISMIRWIV